MNNRYIRQPNGEIYAYTQPKHYRYYYKTAIAAIDCELFKAGEFVAVNYIGSRDGVHEYNVRPAHSREVRTYPEYFLTDFVL